MIDLSRFQSALFFAVMSVSTMLSGNAFASLDFITSKNQSTNAFVSVDEAFPFNFIQQDDSLFLDWQIKPDYYLYQQRISVSAHNAQISHLIMETGAPHNDEFFGDTNIYTKPLSITVPLISVGEEAELTIHYQGCAAAGFCYPPEIRTIPVSQLKAPSSYKNNIVKTEVFAIDNILPKKALLTEKKEMVTALTSSSITEKRTKSSETPTISNQSEQQKLANNLSTYWWTPFLFLLLGIGLAFTPCVLPMYPILTGIVLGQGKLSQVKALKLSFIYVQGMALTYTLLGLVVASAGLQFQAALQHPFVLVSISLLFVLLALSMFGLYTIQLPNSLQTKLNNLSQQQKGGHLTGVFIMGAISGLVCSPCTTAPLSGALLYVAKSGDLATGAITLYALAMGMGIPLILAAIFGNKLLPKAGVWMSHVKTLFGFILLAAPVFLLERILPESIALLLWSILGVTAFGWLYHIKSTLTQSWKTSVLGVIAIIGLVISTLPITNLVFNHQQITLSSEATTDSVIFKSISTIDDLHRELALAKQQGKPVMLDLYADWCVACKEFEKYTFHNPNVTPLLSQMVLLQADVTDNNPEDIALLTELDVLGLPTIDFWSPTGEKLPNARLTGFMKAPPFIEHLEKNVISIK